MDNNSNNSNFEQQFTQNVKASAAQPSATYEPYSNTAPATSHKFFLITTIALAAITFVETIALIITLVNFFSYANGDSYEDEVIEDVEGYTEENYTYDADYNVVAMDITCANDSGASYAFALDGKYQSLDASGNLSSFGTYTITNGSLISITSSDGSNKVLYYDGLDVADGLTLYSCLEPGETIE